MKMFERKDGRINIKTGFTIAVLIAIFQCQASYAGIEWLWKNEGKVLYVHRTDTVYEVTEGSRKYLGHALDTDERGRRLGFHIVIFSTGTHLKITLEDEYSFFKHTVTDQCYKILRDNGIITKRHGYGRHYIELPIPLSEFPGAGESKFENFLRVLSGYLNLDNKDIRERKVFCVNRPVNI